MERKVIGIIKSGDMVTIRGDADELRALAGSAMAEEIERLRRENAILRGQLGMMRARDAAHWQELSLENHRKPRRLPEWVKNLQARILTVWACLTLGASAVYGGSENG